MRRVRTTELAQRVGQSVVLKGWLHAVRRLSGVTFVLVRDGVGVAQVVVNEAAALAPLLAPDVGVESVIEVSGEVIAQARAPLGAELVAPSFRVLSAVAEPPPVAVNKREVQGTLPTQLDHAAVALRHPARRAAFRMSAAAMAGFRGALSAQGFVEIQTPKLVASATEGGANVFALDYFGRKAYLAQSPQFYKQTMVGVFERVFEVGPVFRAEPHATARHLSEYVSMDAELGFITSHEDVMAIVREALAGIMAAIAGQCGAELELLGVTLPAVPATIPAIHFEAAQQLILARHGEDARGEQDLSPQHERWLGEWAQAEHGSAFLFVTGYPMAKRPFYTMPSPADRRWSNSFDLLFCGMELVTGGQRLHLYGDYIAALEAAGLPLEPFAGYLEAFRYGMPPHGGFAIGLERLIKQLTGAENLRWTTLFPRDMARLTP